MCAVPQRQHLTKLYRHFDRNQNERVYYPDLLDAIRGTLSPRRLNMLHQIFDFLDPEQHGAVDQVAIIKQFERGAHRHPQVLSGEKKAADVVREFALAFEGAGARNNGAVTREDFIRFYSGISASVPYDDDFFLAILTRVWGIKEFVPKSLASTILAGTPGAVTSATPLLARCKAIFREKVRQKTLNSKSEIENLRLVFKFFDLTNSGTVDFPGFQKALARFGITLDANTMQLLFDEFDVEGKGRIDYLLFATTLYEEEVASAAHHQFNRSQQFKQSQRAKEEAERPESRREYVDSKAVLLSSPAAAVEKAGFAAAAAADASSSSDWKRATARKTLSQKERENSVLPTVVFVLGGPGVGTSTQCARVTREFGFTHLNVSEMLASERANPASAIGAALASVGSVSPDVLVSFLARAIQDAVHKGSLYFLVDGFPTTMRARQTWEAVMSSKVDVPFMIYFETAQSIMEQRLASRARHTGRPLEAPEALQRKFAQFAKETIEVVNSFGAEGRLQVVDAGALPDEVYAQVQKIISEL